MCRPTEAGARFARFSVRGVVMDCMGNELHDYIWSYWFSSDGCRGWRVVGVCGTGNSQCPFQAWLNKISLANTLPSEVHLERTPALHHKLVVHEPHIRKVAHCRCFNSFEDVFGPR